MSLEIGQIAETTASFSREDAAEFAALAGLEDVPSTVPEPLVGGLFSYLLGVRLPGSGTNYLKQEMTFHASAGLDVPLVATVIVTRLRPEKHLVDLETVCTDARGRKIASGRALVYVRDVANAFDVA
uniref:phosphate acetyltransferase n=1 Tax=Stappia sp. TaxID=1870903 RepID=UPI003BAD42EE